jgi:hypothetical protein
LSANIYFAATKPNARDNYTGYTQKNGAVSVAKIIETAPLFCVYPVHDGFHENIHVVIIIKLSYSLNDAQTLKNSFRPTVSCACLCHYKAVHFNYRYLYKSFISLS